MPQLRKLNPFACLFVASLLLAASPARAQAEGSPEVGIVERLGTTLNLDVTLTDERGEPVRLRELVDRPTLLMFVYLSCPGICDPLLREVARNLDQVPLTAGEDYRVLTISFDPNDEPAVARTKQAEILQTMKRRPPPEAWRFLTAGEGVTKPLTDAVGFNYKRDPNGGAYLHASSLIFLSNEGKIVRYINGIEFLPAHLKLAFFDAAAGRQRTVMQSLERLCYAYDPEGRSYVLQINRLILGATGVFVLGFAGFLVRRRRSPGSREVPKAKPKEDTPSEAADV